MPTEPTDPLTCLQGDVSEIKAMLTQALNGNPGAGQPGIWIRLDRVEQFVKAALWMAGVAIVAGVSAVVSAFTGHK